MALCTPTKAFRRMLPHYKLPISAKISLVDVSPRQFTRGPELTNSACWKPNLSQNDEGGRGKAGGNPGAMGAGSLREVGEEEEAHK